MKKILVIHTAYIGDVILITPLLRAIKQLFPKSYLSVIVVPSTKLILSENPYVDEILTFDKRENKFKAFRKLLERVKQETFDIAFLPHSSMTTTLLAFLSRIPQRIGFDRWLPKYLLTERVPFREGIHRINKNLELLSPITNKNFSLQTEIFTSHQISIKINKLAERFPCEKLIAVAPGSIWYTKRWKERYYKRLSEKLNQHGFFIILIGSPEEQDICEKVAPSRDYFIAGGKLNLLESAELIKKCDLMVCNDCGALHIANAVETDVIAFFGPTTRDIGYFPFRRNDKIVEADLSCRPCGSHGGEKCPLSHHKCMENIKPEQIFKIVMDYFAEK
ncbi:MAG: lipopolysaccharide heptosyltransferase II [Candidatus Cloacimonetes bacterium]|nr:lipopolysaccharide heptosyltransferase II [Candidatus Cloacimonadota bacterium]MBS3766815.1 lipopolysaccharide heptosyltransferase II [Candidatus Cloacimonadota bacterium]